MSSSEQPRPRRRALRVAVCVLLFPAWVLVAFICINGFEDYTEVGNLVLLAGIMFFGVWTWWYQEDRDRRRGVDAAKPDEGSSPNGG
jgi:hypothetical protein